MEIDKENAFPAMVSYISGSVVNVYYVELIKI